jgi:hypothetical protein
MTLVGIVGVAAIPAASAQAASCHAAWTTTPSWNKSGEDSFLFQASSDGAGDAMAAGYTYILNTAYRSLVLQWNGNSWVHMTVPSRYTYSTLSGIAVNSASSAVAVGAYSKIPTDPNRAFAVVWNGSSWSVADPYTYRSGPNTFLSTSFYSAASTSSTDVWGVGTHWTGSAWLPLIEHFNGSSWKTYAGPVLGTENELYGVAADSTTDAWAVGYWFNNPTEQSLAIHWNGTGWKHETTPTVGTFSQLKGVGIVSPSDVWAVGSEYNGTASFPMTLHWNGTNWSNVTVPNPTTYGGVLNSVTALGPKDVWAFGSYNVNSFNWYAPLIEHWDGTSWSVVPSAPGVPANNDVAQLNGSAFGGGHLLTTGVSEPNGTAAGSTSAQQMCPTQVLDSGFSPATAVVDYGDSAFWSVPSSDAASHSITDGDATGLFDSGLVAPGGSFSTKLNGAGTYQVIDSATGHLGKVRVAMSASPTSGTTSTLFSLGWAAASPPAGYVFDVQIRRPGQSSFSDWVTSVTSTGAQFTPDAGAGTYTFRARVRKATGGKHTLWSPLLNITVS